MEYSKEKIRNVAIIAHVDHGKTTLVDAFLKQTHVFRDNQQEMNMEAILDSGTLEREKGITIKAKNASIEYKGHKINIIDTPGHADFGGEVERTLNMADGALLIVDAQEGPMPQTKFVLKKALEMKLKIIVVINKIDKPHSDSKKTLNRINDLFLNLVSDMDQLDFPVYYAIGREGMAFKELPNDLSDLSKFEKDISILLDEIIEYVPAPIGDVEGGFQMLITSLDYDPHIGRMLIGRVKRGKVALRDSLAVIDNEDKIVKGTVKALFTKNGLAYKEIESASVGEIIAIAGIESTAIGGTITSDKNIEKLPSIQISPASVQAKFESNTSPFAGKEGKFVTAKQLQQRLEKEKELNIGLDIQKADGGGFVIGARGELQLAILIEELRREGYELQVRRPEVILKKVDGKILEPLEELIIDTPTEYQGAVITALSDRKGELVSMEQEKDNARLTFKILTRNLLGLRNVLINETKGNVVLNNYVIDYVDYDKNVTELYRKGVLVSSETGTAVGYPLNSIQERGQLFIEPATEVYEGMIIGINKYDMDLEVNPCKEREKSGVRRNQAEITHVSLKAPFKLTLEFALVFINKDEILEITPKNIRLRKQYLTKTQRVWANRDTLTEYAKQNLGA